MESKKTETIWDKLTKVLYGPLSLAQPCSNTSQSCSNDPSTGWFTEKETIIG